MLSRSLLAAAAAILAGVAATISALDGDADLVPFFVGLTAAGGIGAWAVREPYGGGRRRLAQTIGGLWLIAAGWIGALLIWQQVMCGCSMPPPMPEPTYLALTATVYHAVGVYLGGVLMAVAAFSRALARA
jgi:hypothetical protein